MTTRSQTLSYQELRALRRNGQEAKIQIPDPTPQWVIVHNQCQESIAECKDQIALLATLRQQSSRVEFSDEKKQNLEVKICRVEKMVHDIFESTKKSIQEITILENDGTLSREEKIIRSNAIKTLSHQLAQQVKLFQDVEYYHSQELRLNDSEKNLYASKVSSSFNIMPDDRFISHMEQEVTQTQIQEEKEVTEREQEIIKLASSINHLYQLFTELNTMIVEQGTVLDRIDYHIEQASIKVEKGKKELIKAEESSRKGPGVNKCICILFFIFIILLIVLIWKESK